MWHLKLSYAVFLTAVPAQSKILCRPDLLNYTLRLFVWAGIILPPPMVLIFVLLGMGPSETLATFIVSKSPWLHTWLPPPVMAVLKLAGFMASYFGFVISTMDLFRCFILLAIVALMAAQFCKSLVDLAEAYFDCVQSLGQQVGMQHFSIFNRIAATINKLGSFIGIMTVGIFSVGFVYVVVRMHSVIPTAFLFLCGLGVFITGYVQLLICNYSEYINDKCKTLLQKYKAGLAMVRNVRKRREMVRCIKGLQPFVLEVGIGEITLLFMDREKKVFVFKSMLDYSMDIVVRWSLGVQINEEIYALYP